MNTSRVIKESLKRVERIERFVRVSKKTVFDRSSASNVSQPSEGSNDKADKKAYSVACYDKEERQKGRIEDRYCPRTAIPE